MVFGSNVHELNAISLRKLDKIEEIKQNERLKVEIPEVESEESEQEYDIQRDVDLMKRILNQGDKVPFTMELMPSKMPSEEFSAAVKVIEDSQDVEALKNAFTTLRKIIIFNTDLIASSPFVIENVVKRIMRYIGSEANYLLTLHSLRTLTGKYFN